MRKSRKWMQLGILLVVLLIGGYAIGNTLQANNQKSPLRIGDKPPDFTLPDMEGNLHSLADYAGKPVIITFWGTFCPSCVQEMPAFNKMYEKWQKQGLEILAINLSEDKLTINRFIQQMNLSYPILRDSSSRTENNYRIPFYPTTFFVDGNGTIVDVQGPMTEEGINERIERLMKP